MKKYRLSLIIKISAIVLMVTIDMLTKYYFQNYFNNGGEDFTVIKHLFGITYTINTGAAFGIFGDNTVMLSIFTVLFLAVFSFVDFYYGSNNGWYVTGFSLIIGGALGNFIDRIALKGVRDFIELKFIDFPIFNCADLFLTIGVACYIVYLLFYELKKPKQIDITEDKE